MRAPGKAAILSVLLKNFPESFFQTFFLFYGNYF